MRPFPLTKFILCVCVKQRKYDKLNSFSTAELFQGQILAQHLLQHSDITVLLQMHPYRFPSSYRSNEANAL